MWYLILNSHVKWSNIFALSSSLMQEKKKECNLFVAFLNFIVNILFFHICTNFWAMIFAWAFVGAKYVLSMLQLQNMATICSN